MHAFIQCAILATLDRVTDEMSWMSKTAQVRKERGTEERCTQPLGSRQRHAGLRSEQSGLGDISTQFGWLVGFHLAWSESSRLTA